VFENISTIKKQSNAVLGANKNGGSVNGRREARYCFESYTCGLCPVLFPSWG